MDTSWVPLASLIVTALAIPTLVGLVYKDIQERRKENSKEKQKEKQRQFKEGVREVVQEEIKPVKETIAEINNKIDLVSDGTMCTLRNDIKNCYYECLEKGYRNDYDFKNIHELYEAYTNLGGNSFIEDVMARFKEVPPKDVYLKECEEKQKVAQQKQNTRTKGSQGKEKVENQ